MLAYLSMISDDELLLSSFFMRRSKCAHSI